MSNPKKLLCLALLLLSSVWIFFSGRQAILLVLVVFLTLMIYALVRTLCFYFVSDSTHARVIRVRAVERPDSEGYSNWTYYVTFQLTLANREYVSKEDFSQFRLEVGDIVRLRYRRNDPQDMHYGYWSSLFWLAILLTMVSAGIYMTWHWPWWPHG